MKISFFETDVGLDPLAVKSGIYIVELLKESSNLPPVPLYIGESVWIVHRCGTHLYSFFNNPQYFGLEKKDLENESFTLRFSVLDSIKDAKSILGFGKYHELEKKEIEKEKPLTQLQTSDRQLKPEERVIQVQAELKKRGFI